jgi:hypothetical protein
MDIISTFRRHVKQVKTKKRNPRTYIITIIAGFRDMHPQNRKSLKKCLPNFPAHLLFLLFLFLLSFQRRGLLLNGQKRVGIPTPGIVFGAQSQPGTTNLHATGPFREFGNSPKGGNGRRIDTQLIQNPKKSLQTASFYININN